ncbi:LD-carboxypeptidase [Candidatus Nomurabacteria bacterium]|nr:LD-carboxypeptidase [Candidatus Nomurabacteria bacterium]
MNDFVNLPKLSCGDQVAVISPSSGLPGLFPWVQDLGIQRLQTNFGLFAKEYPTTRLMGSSLEARARDIMDAFGDSKNKAVFASIGGNDQIKLIKLLDPKVFTSNPKPFFGYSDNTHLHNFLWNLGIPSYYGSCIMTELAFQVKIPDLTDKYLRQALFKRGKLTVKDSSTFNDIGLNWSIKNNLSKNRIFEANEGTYWDGHEDATGILWGGCVESLIAQVSAEVYLPSPSIMNSTILFIETAEDIPDHWVVEYLLTGLGERGWLSKIQAILVGRPKTWDFDKPLSKKARVEYRKKQRSTIIKTIRSYNKDLTIVQNVDFGHTAPQITLPYGGKCSIRPDTKEIVLYY